MASLDVTKKASGGRGGKGGKGAASTRKPPLAKFWSDEDIDEKLKGYIEVPEESWELIKHAQHVRYFTKAADGKPGGYRPGGFIVKNPVSITIKGKDIKSMKLQNGFDQNAKGYSQWSVAYENTDKVYMKIDATLAIARRDSEMIVQALNDHVEETKKALKKLKEANKELKEEIKMMRKTK